ncbi:hypothetical protein OAG99_01785 [Akkermansiaceae bacterium]|nr:hypothetical protein [Akkermansiaceae bacterium]
MLVPPLEVQREFAKLVRAVTSKFEVSFSAKSASEDLFSSLQQRAFRGEL